MGGLLRIGPVADRRSRKGAYCTSAIRKGGLLRINDPERGPFTDLNSDEGAFCGIQGAYCGNQAVRGPFTDSPYFLSGRGEAADVACMAVDTVQL